MADASKSSRVRVEGRLYSSLIGQYRRLTKTGLTSRLHFLTLSAATQLTKTQANIDFHRDSTKRKTTYLQCTTWGCISTITLEIVSDGFTARPFF